MPNSPSSALAVTYASPDDDKRAHATSRREGLPAWLSGLDLTAEPVPAVRGRGRPRKDRAAIARSLVARAMLDLPTIVALVEILQRDPELRMACGWNRPGDVPSCSTFSRLAPEILQDLPEGLRARVAPYHTNHLPREIAQLPDQSPVPDPAFTSPELAQLRNTFVALARQTRADLSLRQFGTLLACYVADGPQTVRALEQRLGLDNITLKHTLDRLERLRLTRATRDKHARRRYLVHRTRRGTEFLDDLFASISGGPEPDSVPAGIAQREKVDVRVG